MLKFPYEALEDLEKTCLLEPNSDYQHGLRGAIYLDMRRWNEAMKSLNKAIEYYPTKITPIGNRAELYVKLRRYGTLFYLFNHNLLIYNL